MFALIGALGIGWLSRRSRPDVATGLALVVLLGLGALFLSMSTEYAPEIYSLLFGEVLGVSASEVAPVAALGVVAVAAIIVLYRPLMLASVLPEASDARGVRGHRLETCFLVVVALATSMALPVVGALLIFSLMVGPPAAARSFTSRPLHAMALSVAIALATVWAAIAASYLPTGRSGSSSARSARSATAPAAAGRPGAGPGRCPAVPARSPRRLAR